MKVFIQILKKNFVKRILNIVNLKLIRGRKKWRQLYLSTKRLNLTKIQNKNVRLVNKGTNRRKR